MYLSLNFTDLAKPSVRSLINAEATVVGFGLSHPKINAAPMNHPCTSVEFNLAGGQTLGKVLTELCDRSVNQKYMHHLQLVARDNSLRDVSLGEYLTVLADSLSIPEDRLRVVVESYPLNGSFKGTLMREGGTWWPDPEQVYGLGYSNLRAD